ncbi:rhodanese-like domain-containing protein [Paenibacillus rigui]|uniref:Sulfurtransferase n=1 Tax=Paenibacillus rigui TaxID=554312 RepID=A0A229UXF1_9BACL|nr:rhodanese-like domain-containing protein [Paenibacillus rigui]OXM88098.1 sulfurtransferase [Paenibacillus rigui]
MQRFFCVLSVNSADGCHVIKNYKGFLSYIFFYLINTFVYVIVLNNKNIEGKGAGTTLDDFDFIDPREFVAKLNDHDLGDALIIDVREQMEWDYYHLEEATLLPMSTIPARMSELPADRKLYIVCAHGVRSANVCYYLKHQGYEDVVNVEGGMAAVAALKGFQYD